MRFGWRSAAAIATGGSLIAAFMASQTDDPVDVNTASRSSASLTQSGQVEWTKVSGMSSYMSPFAACPQNAPEACREDPKLKERRFEEDMAHKSMIEGLKVARDQDTHIEDRIERLGEAADYARVIWPSDLPDDTRRQLADTGRVLTDTLRAKLDEDRSDAPAVKEERGESHEAEKMARLYETYKMTRSLAADLDRNGITPKKETYAQFGMTEKSLNADFMTQAQGYGDLVAVNVQHTLVQGNGDVLKPLLRRYDEIASHIKGMSFEDEKQTDYADRVRAEFCAAEKQAYKNKLIPHRSGHCPSACDDGTGIVIQKMYGMDVPVCTKS